jgi:maltooligosyltrehalose trehalohydrolase
MVTPLEASGRGMDAQWDDDLHHALHALLTGERRAYYVDFGSIAAVAKVLTSAFFHDGTFSTFRGHMHGRPVDRATTPGHRFVVALQNHDQVGNREAGERITALTTAASARLGAVIVFTSPFTPMLWMGEEWAASTPWPYFTSHPEPELDAKAVKRRLDEFADHDWDASRMVSPQDPAAFYEAKLRWDEVGESEHATMLSFYRELIELRHREPDLVDPRLDLVQADYDEEHGWLLVHRGALRVAVNFSDEPRSIPVAVGEVLLATGPVDTAVGWLRLGPKTAVIARAR